jgi:t-SNARE complex subunit (syntaxin)
VIKEENAIMKDEDSASEEDERNRSMESVSSDELDGELNLSCDEDEAERQRVFVSQRKAQRKKPARKFRQEIDTNVIKINLNTLKTNAEIATGDPIFCKKCNAIFNANSKVDDYKPEP